MLHLGRIVPEGLSRRPVPCCSLPPVTGRNPVFTGNTARPQRDPAYRRGMEPRAVSRREPATSRIVAGLIVMIVGLAILADRLDTAVSFPGQFWPLILVVMGAARLADSA